MTNVLTQPRPIRLKGRSFLALALTPELPFEDWLARLDDLAARPEHAALLADLQQRLRQDWDADAVDARIRASQRRRLFLRELGMKHGGFPDWTYEARPGDKARFVRPTTAGKAVGPKPRMRFPFVPPTPPDRKP